MHIPTFTAHPRRQARDVRRVLLLVVAMTVVAGCATGRAIRSGTTAESQGDWDTAVTYYREALSRAPERSDVRIKLERATRMASAEHVQRARQLESQDQLPGAIAEYRLAAGLDPSNVLAAQKASELERRLRDQVEAARPPPPADALRAENAQTGIPRLDPRTVVPAMRFPNASVRDILSTISQLTGINITYDQGLDTQLGRPYPIDVQETPIEEVLSQILTANSLTFKVQNARTIFVYLDNPVNRLRYEDRYLQNFYLSSANAAQVAAQLNQLLAGTQMAVRPSVSPNETTNTLTVVATAPVLEVIDAFLRAADRPVPEVLIEAEILEVDRSFLRQIGLDLNQFAFGFTFSPEVSPGTAPGTFPPATPPPFNLNTLSGGVSPADFYVTSPTALVQLLESNQNTRTLSKPSTRGMSGQPVTLQMGQEVPVPQTVFQAGAIGGVANIPTTSVQYQTVGVNLTFVPTVTYNDEIILSNMTIEKSGVGANLEVGGQTFPTFTTRTATQSTRLRDGESTLVAGLLLDEEDLTARSVPGLSSIPFIRNLLGSTTSRSNQTDVVMILTPRIVRGHGLTAEDVRPMYVGTGQNVTTSTTPQLLSPEALGLIPAAAPAPAPPAPPAPTLPAPVETPPASPAATIVPVEPAPQPAAPAVGGTTRVLLTPPSAGPAGALIAGGGPYTMPIQIAGADDLATLSLTVVFNPSIVRDVSVTAGSFMSQGGVTGTFVPGIDAAGRIDLVFSRPEGSGASGAGLLAAIAFRAGTPGTTEMQLSGVATSTDGRSIPLTFTTTRLTVR